MYKKILVPLDGSAIAESVLPHVQKIAQGSVNPEIILFRVCEPPVVLADYPADLRGKWEDHIKDETDHAMELCSLYLGNAEKDLRKAGFKASTQSGLGKPAEEIVSYAVQNEVDLIIMATHGRSGVSRWAFGSTSEKVVQGADCPVFIVRSKGKKS